MSDDLQTEIESASTDAYDTREYELVAAFEATLDGPDGAVQVLRRYEGLPRHNDEVDPGAVDSNDEFVDRPDEVHVHTEFYEAGSEEYVRDEHDTWRPDDRSAFTGESAFADACRDHFASEAAAVYRAGAAELSDRDEDVTGRADGDAASE